MNHVMTGCKVALQQGRYKFRHDRVLKEIAGFVEEKVTEQNKKSMKRKRQWINFVKSGSKGKPAIRESETYLSTANDWKLTVDLVPRLKIPIEIADTRLRPDMIIVSKKTRQLGIIELTVPTEERIEVSAEGKRLKYGKKKRLEN